LKGACSEGSRTLGRIILVKFWRPYCLI